MSYKSSGPLSFVGGFSIETQDGAGPCMRLQVIDAAGTPSTATISANTAHGFGAGQSVFVQLASVSDCVVLARVGDVPDNAIALSSVQQHNFHAKAGTAAEWRVFQPEAGQRIDLVDLEAEVSQLGKVNEALEVDATELAKHFGREYFGRMLAVNEAVVLEFGGHQLLLRVSAANTLAPEEQEEAVGYHCFRGLLTPDTQLFLTELGGSEALPAGAAGAAGAAEAAAGPAGAAGLCREARGRGGEQAVDGSGAQPLDSLKGDAEQGSSSSSSSSESGSSSDDEAPQAAGPADPQSTLAGRGRVRLLNARRRGEAGLSPNMVRVVTSDGEWFPVRRKLLRPCISLTKAVRAEEGCCEVAVDVDCLTFDRVLIFLEAEALGKPAPGFGVHVIPQLLEAAQKLGLRSLEEHCRKKLGDMESRLRWFSFEEIKQRNAAGECLLVLDGMVLDVTRWLPEHPGGSTIIPRQSLNLDCSRFFELYHHSRESFLYVQEFYIGEVLPEDRGEIPRKEPSADFLAQLKEYTAKFRMQPEKVQRNL